MHRGQIGQLQQNPSVFASQIQPETKTALFALPAAFHHFKHEYLSEVFEVVFWAPISSGPMNLDLYLCALFYQFNYFCLFVCFGGAGPGGGG